MMRETAEAHCGGGGGIVSRQTRQKRRVIKAAITAFLLVAVVTFVNLIAASDFLVLSNVSAPTSPAVTDTNVHFLLDDSSASSNSSSESDDGDTCDEIPSGLSREEQCNFVKQNCSDFDGHFDYLHFRYCTMGSTLITSLLGTTVLFLWSFCLFFLMSETAEAHFCPSLSEISSTLRLSPDLAGMTILALGNGGPDVFSCVAAIQNRDFAITMGSLLGAGCFITHVIVGAVGFVKKAQMKVYPFTRDLFFYLGGLLFVFLMLRDGSIHAWEAIGFLIYYVLYVLIATAIHIVKARMGTAVMVVKQEPKETDPLLPSHQQQPQTRKRTPSVHISVVPETPNEETTTTTTTTTILNTPRQRSLSQGSTTPSLGSLTPTSLSPAALRSVNRTTPSQQFLAPPSPLPELSLPPKPQLSGYVSTPPDLSRALINEDVEVTRVTPPPSPSSPSFSPITANYAAGVIGTSLSSAVPIITSDEMNVPGSYRHDGMLALQHKKKHMLRHGLLNIVQEWKDTPLPDYIAPSPHNEAANQSPIGRWLEFVEWEDKGLFGKILHVAMLPFCLILHLTIPHADDESFNKYLLALAMFLSPALVLFATDTISIMIGGVVPLVAVIMGISGAIGVSILTVTKKPIFRPTSVQFAITLYSFFVSMMWMYMSADEIVSLLGAISKMFHISPTIVGLTVLAWGNCVGDFVADITVARQGYPDMAIAATYAGPLFNLLIGLGAGGTMLCLRTGQTWAFPLTDMALIDLAYLAIALIVTYIFLAIRKFTVDRITGLFLLCGYAVFMVLSFLVEFKVLHFLN